MHSHEGKQKGRGLRLSRKVGPHLKLLSVAAPIKLSSKHPGIAILAITQRPHIDPRKDDHFTPSASRSNTLRAGATHHATQLANIRPISKAANNSGISMRELDTNDGKPTPARQNSSTLPA